jgi:hypothetical protein
VHFCGVVCKYWSACRPLLLRLSREAKLSLLEESFTSKENPVAIAYILMFTFRRCPSPWSGLTSFWSKVLDAENNRRQLVIPSSHFCQRIQPYWKTKIKIDWGAPLTIVTDLKCLAMSHLLNCASIKIRTNDLIPNFSVSQPF